jgi:hypothetical protein
MAPADLNAPKVGKMFFMVCVIKDVRETVKKGAFHSKFKGVSAIAVELVAYVVGEIVMEEVELFSLGGLSLLEWSSEGKGNRDRGKVSVFATVSALV